MKLKLACWTTVLALCVVPAAQAAEFSFTPTLTNDYDFRGISLSNQEPALQLSFDVAFDSGLYGFVWGSNTDFGVPGVDTEIDFAVGYGNSINDRFSYDLGIVMYTYIGGSEFNYPEIYAGVEAAVSESFTVGGKLWYSNDYAASDEAGTYVEVNATYALPIWDMGLTLHAGYSAGDYWDLVEDRNGNPVGSYVDYSVGLTKDVGNLSFALKYVDGSDLDDVPGSNLNSTDRRVILSLSTTLPWAE